MSLEPRLVERRRKLKPGGWLTTEMQEEPIELTSIGVRLVWGDLEFVFVNDVAVALLDQHGRQVLSRLRNSTTAAARVLASCRLLR